MSTTKSIPGIQRGPDFDKESYESHRVQENAKAVKLNRPAEANDPIVAAAVDAVSEMSDMLGRKIDVQYETSSKMVIMTVYSGDGEKVISRIPPEEAIRLSHRLREDRANFLESIL